MKWMTLFSAIFVFLLMAIPAVAATEGRADEELPLHAQRLSDRVHVPWVAGVARQLRVKVRDVNIHENNIEAIWSKLPAAKESGPVGPERP
jgi:hypothetical protein